MAELGFAMEGKSAVPGSIEGLINLVRSLFGLDREDLEVEDTILRLTDVAHVVPLLGPRRGCSSVRIRRGLRGVNAGDLAFRVERSTLSRSHKNQPISP